MKALGCFQNSFLYKPNQSVWVLIKNNLSYKEVIQPQVPLGLPCYDFTDHEPQSGKRPPEG